MTIELRTSYLGLELRSPIVASAAPHNGEPDDGRRAWSGPASGPSSCPRCSRRRSSPRSSSSTARWSRGPSISPRPSTTSPPSTASSAPRTGTCCRSNGSRPRSTCRSSPASTPRTSGGWVRYARLIEDAGADALELNLYHLAADPRRDADGRWRRATWRSSRTSAARSTIPLAVKLSPYYSALANFAAAAVGGRRGRAGPVQPLLPAGPRPRDARRRAAARAEPAVGAAAAAALDRDPAPAARRRRVAGGASGVTTGTDAAKALLVGADVVMMTSALLRHGPEHVPPSRASSRHGWSSTSTSRSTSCAGA